MGVYITLTIEAVAAGDPSLVGHRPMLAWGDYRPPDLAAPRRMPARSAADRQSLANRGDGTSRGSLGRKAHGWAGFLEDLRAGQRLTAPLRLVGAAGTTGSTAAGRQRTASPPTRPPPRLARRALHRPPHARRF